MDVFPVCRLKHARRGFTFIEILIVVVIIGILAAGVTPRIRNSFSNLEFEGFVKDVFYMCRYLQGSAMGQSKIYYLSIAQDTGGFQAWYKNGGQLEPLKGRFAKAIKTPQGVSFSLNHPDKKGIYFFPDGSVEELTVVFKNSAGRNISLIVQGAAGVIKIK